MFARITGRAALTALWWACCLAAPAFSGEADDAKEILAAIPAPGGLCLHLGCGRAETAGLTAALGETSGMLVHGLALDDAALARARAAIQERGVAGKSMAEKLAGKSLPYLQELARAVVIEDAAALEAAGIGKDEVQRVLAPGGLLIAKSSGKWTATAKPRPKTMDEWTHPHHGPDGNMVSADQALTFPLGLRWVDGVPTDRGGFGSCASCRAAVLAGGRCFTVNIDELNSNGTAILKARDAFSGFPLWRFDCEGSYGKVELDWRNTWPLAASETRVCTAKPAGVVLLDAATGKVEATCATKFQPRRLLLTEGSVVAACWEKLELSNPKDGFESDGIRAVWWPAGAGSIETFDAATGTPKWSLPLAAVTIVANEGTLYALTHQGNPPTERTLVAVELATGKEKWRVPHTAFGAEADTCLNFAGPGCVVVSKTKAKGPKGVFVLNAADGKVLHTIPATVARCIVGTELWCSEARFDLKTGAKLPGQGLGGNYAAGNIVGGCVPSIVVAGKYITASRGGGYLQLPDPGGKQPVKLSFPAVRGACIMGMLPANGMFYTAQNNCACVGSQVGGFVACGPGNTTPAAADFEQARPVEKGPAFGATDAPATADDWPTYRQNNERSGGMTAKLPEQLKQLWKTPCVKLGEGRYGEAWHARIGCPQPLTAPIVAAGLVIVGGYDSGEVIALKPESGAPVWRKLLGSRIDSPPTYHQGLLLVGCHDGWVYALRAKDGELAYRVRIAPLDRRLVAYGLVASVWPAAGSVLVHDGVAYATAGRSTSTEGGVALVAFKPGSGETVWAKCLGEKLSMMQDVLLIREGELTWHTLRMDPKTGAELPPTQRYYAHSGLLDGGWTNGFNKRTGGGCMLGRICASMLAWNEQLVAAPGWAVARAKADIPKPAANAGIKHPDAFKPDEFAWKTNLEPELAWARVYAMAMSGNTVLYAGSIHNGWKKGQYDGSMLWIKSVADGKTKQPALKLDAVPCLDGLAVSGGRVFLTLQDGSLLCLGQ